MTTRVFSFKHLAAALLSGLALRLFFFVKYPFFSGDTKFYEELARNLLDHGVYGLFVQSQLIPMNVRMPGYPAFLAAIYGALGRSGAAVMAVQAAVDLGTCVVAALLAARLAPASKRTLVAAIALWMAALCPFTAHYTSVVLTETLATFLTTLAIFVFVCIFDDPRSDISLHSLDRKSLFTRARWWLLAGLLVGAGTLVRPETPLLLVAVGMVLAVRWRRRADWSKLALAALWMAVGLLLPLAPWAARNAHTLGRAEFLSPRYAETPGDFVARGFHAWTGTWMTRYRDAYLVTWKLNHEPILMDALPESAFDTEAERARVAAVLSEYNKQWRMTPMMDHEFDTLASERTARRPLRTYVFIPVARAWMIWFTPRIELLPYSGRLWPPAKYWQDNATDFSVTLGYGVLGFVYVGFALAGLWHCRAHPAFAFLLTYLVVRTAFLTQMQTVEPRYVMECFPALLAIAAQVWAGRPWVTESFRDND